MNVDTVGEPIRTVQNPDAEATDHFGQRLALWGDLMAVSAIKGDDGGLKPGTTYIFNAMSGSLVMKIDAPEAPRGGFFGGVLAISEHRLLVSAPLEDPERQGAVYLFAVSSGELLQKLRPPSQSDYAVFGISLALDETRALVGASQDSSEGGDAAGAAYLFEAADGTFRAKLHAPDATPGALFGISVALCGTRLVVSAQGALDNAGAVYLFDAAGRFERQIVAPEGAARDQYFGMAVRATATRLLVGAPYHDSAAGAAYWFDVETGALLQKLTAPNSEPGSMFGNSLALNHQRMLVSSAKDGQKLQSGGVYLYDVRGEALNTPELLAKFVSPYPSVYNTDSFGENVALRESEIFVTATDADSHRGEVYVFRAELPEKASAKSVRSAVAGSEAHIDRSDL